MKPPRLVVKAVVEVYNQAIALILRELDAIDEGDAIRAQLVEFAGKGTEYKTLFAGAGPSDDGTLDTARMSENVSHLGDAKDAKDAEDRLAQILYETLRTRCFSRALTFSGCMTRRFATGDSSGSKRLSQRIKTMLEPIATAATEAALERRRNRRVGSRRERRMAGTRRRFWALAIVIGGCRGVPPSPPAKPSPPPPPPRSSPNVRPLPNARPRKKRASLERTRARELLVRPVSKWRRPKAGRMRKATMSRWLPAGTRCSV